VRFQVFTNIKFHVVVYFIMRLCVTWQVVTNVSEEHTASICSVEFLNMRAVSSSEMLITIYQYIRHRTPEDHSKNSLNVNSFLGLLHRVVVGDVADVSEIHATSMSVGS
jgi:hypothetical protein